MRSFLLAPLLVATAASALAIDLTPGSDVAPRAVIAPRAVMGASMVGQSAFHRRGPSPASHKRLVRRRKCKAPRPKPSSSSSTAPPSSTGTLGNNSTDGSQWEDHSTASSSSTSSWEDGQSSSSSKHHGHHTSTSSADPWAPTTSSQPTSTDGGDDGDDGETWTDGISSTNTWDQPTTTHSWQPTSTNPWDQPTTTSKSEGGEWTDSDGPTSTTSSDAPAPTNTQTGDGALGAALMPVSGSRFWSTANNGVPMSQALKVQSGKLNSESPAPDGSMAMAVNYPAGQVGGSSGLSFYASGDINNVDITQATEVLFSYSVFFDNNFEWMKGGKLPGLYGGSDFASAKTCSGGNKRDDCFSARMMWREDGKGEIYDYIPPSAAKNYCNVPPMSECNNDYGASIGRGAWNWQKGQWNTVAMRVKLNDGNQANGEQQIWLNGESVLLVKDLQLRLSDNIRFQGIMAQSFFGGSDASSWAPSQEQHSWFKDWTLSILN